MKLQANTRGAPTEAERNGVTHAGEEHDGIGRADASTPGGLRALADVSLTSDRQRMLEAALSMSGGSVEWRCRKLAEATELLALSQIAPDRLCVQRLDLREALRAELLMHAPVPRRHEGGGDLVVGGRATLGLTYRQEAMLVPTPGYSFVEVLSPPDLYHAQVPPDPPHLLCLSTELPAGIRVRNLVLMVYEALTLQSLMIDEMDPAGVMHPEAARFWQENTHRLPLTRTPFLGNPVDVPEDTQPSSPGLGSRRSDG